VATARNRRSDPKIGEDIAPSYAECYLQALGRPDFLEAVYLDLSPGIAIYTVYRGPFATVAGTLFDAEIAVIDRFPDIPVNFETVNVESREAVLPASAQRVYPAA
jgi:hypothetical protein